MLTHAQVRAIGAADALEAFRARLAAALAGEAPLAAFEPREAAGEQVYDIKVEGLPFPALAAASLDVPEVEVRIEWVDPRENLRGTALIRGGKLEAQSAERLGASRTGESLLVEVEAAGGRLALALLVEPIGVDVCEGYVACAEHDAMFEARRDAPDGTVRLHFTAGAPEWAVRCIVPPRGAVEAVTLQAPQPLDHARYQAIKRARAFCAAWLWLAADDEEDVAIERARLARYGHAERPANVRSARLRELRQAAADDAQVLVRDELPAEFRWVAEAIRRCGIMTAPPTNQDQSP